MANGITVRGLEAKWRGADRWLSDGGSRGAGRLVAKLSQAGATFYFQYFDAPKGKRFLPIDRDKLADARAKAAELSALYRSGVTDLHAYFEQQQAAEQRARKSADDAARRAEEASKRSTLRELLDAYVKYLEGAGKQSAGDVRRIFDKHVYVGAPELAALRAAEIPVNDFVTVIGQVVEAGKGRTAAKLRSYLRAAYALAIKSKTDPSAPLALRAFGIESNPLTSIDALSKFSRTRDRNLSPDEMAAFLKRLNEFPEGPQKDAVMLCLLLGGQRTAQLLRIKPGDVALSAATITLYDPKGRRKQPRTHMLPLTKRAAVILQRRIDGLDRDTPLFTSDGRTRLRSETVSGIVTDISAAMLKAKETREGFQMRDLRRTAETMMAALRMSSDVRAQVQSHGLGGVQARHYDRHDYALEKRAALEKWQRHLDRLAANKTATVTPIRKKA